MTVAQYRAHLSVFANATLSDDEVNSSIEAIEAGEADVASITQFDEEYAGWKANQ